MDAGLGQRHTVSNDSSLRRSGGTSYVIHDLPQDCIDHYLQESIITRLGDTSRPRWNVGIGYQRMVTLNVGTYVAFDLKESEVLFTYPDGAVNQSARVLLLHATNTFAAFGLERALSEGTTVQTVLLFIPRHLEAFGPPLQLRFTAVSSWHDIQKKIEEHGRTTYADPRERALDLVALLESQDPRIYRYPPFERMGSMDKAQYVIDHLCLAVTTADCLMHFEGYGMFLASCAYDNQHLNFVRVKVCFELQSELLKSHQLYVASNGGIWSELQQLYKEYEHIWHEPDDWTEESVKAGWLRRAITK